MKFIKLTEANERAETLIINVAHIAVLQLSVSGKDTQVKMACHRTNRDGKFISDYYFVKESMADIERILSDE